MTVDVEPARIHFAKLMAAVMRKRHYAGFVVAAVAYVVLRTPPETAHQLAAAYSHQEDVVAAGILLESSQASASQCRTLAQDDEPATTFHSNPAAVLDDSFANAPAAAVDHLAAVHVADVKPTALPQLHQILSLARSNPGR